MINEQTVIKILMADDDQDDQLLCKEALAEARLVNGIDFVSDGEELMDYLFQQGAYADIPNFRLPDLILLDLNMPRKDGREALREIKSTPQLKRIPVIVLTTSEAEQDVIRSYDLGVNSFIVKPVTFDSLVGIMETITEYWMQIVRLPSRDMRVQSQ